MSIAEHHAVRIISNNSIIDNKWEFLGNSYECRVLLCPAEEGGFTAFATNLTGVISEGDTEQEAIANIMEAFVAVVADYLANGETIPWGNVEVERRPGSKERWIVANVQA